VPGDQRLVAYVVPIAGSAIIPHELRALLSQKLPAGMVPSAFVLLDAFPLLPNGKVDRRALPPPESQPVRAVAAHVAPRNPVEESLARIWSEVLGLERVGIHDNFFELGGHSLLATRVVSRVRNEFQTELPLRCIFDSPTVAGLAMAVLQAKAMRVGPGEGAAVLDQINMNEQLPGQHHAT